jgi:hypothetical protein
VFTRGLWLLISTALRTVVEMIARLSLCKFNKDILYKMVLIEVSKSAY